MAVLGAAGLLGAGWASAPARAGQPVARTAVKAKLPTATVSLTASSSSIRAGGRLTFSGSSFYASGAQERLTVFATRGTKCPRAAHAPRGASVAVLETVDNFVSLSVFTGRLSPRGHWVLCGYLSTGSRVTAHARARFTVR